MGSIFQVVQQNGTNKNRSTASKILHPNIQTPNPKVVSAKGNYLILENGQKVLDASAGPGVACIGHGNTEVRDAVVAQMDRLSYCHSLSFANQAAEDLAEEVVNSTNGVMARATIVSSGTLPAQRRLRYQPLFKVRSCTNMSTGSEAVEAALKLARQYFVEKEEPERVHFIARKGAFHGTTLSSLALTAKPAVRRPFDAIMLNDNVSFVSTPNAYRGMYPAETEPDYVARLAEELDAEFERVGPGRVCAFVAETVAGTVSMPHIRAHTLPFRVRSDMAPVSRLS